MKFYTKQHKYYCGIDLYARSMYVCLLDRDGQVVYHKDIKANPDALERAIAVFDDYVAQASGLDCHTGIKTQLIKG